MAKNTLTLAQQIKLADWLRANWKDLEALSAEDIAKRANAEIGLVMNPWQLAAPIKAAGLVRTKWAK